MREPGPERGLRLARTGRTPAMSPERFVEIVSELDTPSRFAVVVSRSTPSFVSVNGSELDLAPPPPGWDVRLNFSLVVGWYIVDIAGEVLWQGWRLAELERFCKENKVGKISGRNT